MGARVRHWLHFHNLTLPNDSYFAGQIFSCLLCSCLSVQTLFDCVYGFDSIQIGALCYSLPVKFYLSAE
jgi:hypothetical protein